MSTAEKAFHAQTPTHMNAYKHAQTPPHSFIHTDRLRSLMPLPSHSSHTRSFSRLYTGIIFEILSRISNIEYRIVTFGITNAESFGKKQRIVYRYIFEWLGYGFQRRGITRLSIIIISYQLHIHLLLHLPQPHFPIHFTTCRWNFWQELVSTCHILFLLTSSIFLFALWRFSEKVNGTVISPLPL